MAEIDDIATLISLINLKYSSKPEKLRKLLKEKSFDEVYLKVKKGSEDEIPPAPVWEHSLTYDTTAIAPLESIYFWILDFMRDCDIEVEKIVDNFAASPGSGYFADLVGRQTKMQEESMKIMATIGTMIRSLINLLYDLKEFEIRLKHYDLAKSKNAQEKEAGILALKQIWMDKVDMQRGRGSINAMTYELGFATLRDAFMAAQSVEEVDKMDLNDRVKRVLKPRIAEFLEWKDRSEKELRKRFEIERNWVKSQVENIKIYSRWAKPYLKAAEELMMKEKARAPELVKAWQMILLELCLFGKKKINVKGEAEMGNLPKSFRNLKMKRDYYACVVVDFVVRGIPAKGMFSGRVDINFKAFALNSDELKAFNEALEKSDLGDAMKMVTLVTEESVEVLAEDIKHFIGEKEKKEEKERREEKEKKKTELRKESYEESVVRDWAEQVAATLCFKIYDTFKKAYGMASMAEPEWEYPPKWRVWG